MARSRRGRRLVIGAAAAMLALGSVSAAALTRTKQAGPEGRGGVTPIGYRVTPTGKQTTLGDLPLGAVASPDGNWLIVSNDGQGEQSLQVVNAHTSAVVQTIPYASPQAVFVGLAFSPDGTRLYASAGGNNKIRTYSFAAGRLTEGSSLTLPTTNPAGQTVNPYPSGMAVSPDGRRVLVADQLADAFTEVDVATGATQTVAVGHDPYWVTLSSDGATAYVTNQGGNTVSAVDVSGMVPVVKQTITVGTHPNKAVLDAAGRNLYVADGDSDQVSVIDTETNAVTRTISLAPYANATVGSNPDALALSADGRTLYVANSGNNDVAIVDVAQGKVAGLIPTAWYPTAVVATGTQLFVTNAKGLGAGPNDGSGYPDPTKDSATQSPDQYVGSMMVGTLSTVALPISAGRLHRDTAQVAANDGFDHRGAVPVAKSVMPRHLGESSPIKHVIYVVKENRTYDQEFGSLGKGNGDPKLNLWGDDVAPNSRTLERRFATLDNFYADAEVSAQGWNWVVASNSNPYSEQTWEANYSSPSRNHPYPSESNDPAIAPNKNPTDAYVWDRLADAGVSFRNYGMYVDQFPIQEVAGDPVLNNNTDHDYEGWDLDCPDSTNTFHAQASTCLAPRIQEWLREFKGYESNGNLPTFEFLRLPNDHTSGTDPGTPTPSVYTADNDWALGQLVDAVSHSQYWKSTAIFVTEDDAQNGPDHVDAHRTLAWVISPYTQTGKVDSTFYSTASMMRTMEQLVGIQPLTQFDAYSTPMAASFTSKPNFTPYTSVKPSVNFSAINTAASPMASASARQNLTKEDQIDEQEFNEAIWQSVKGARSQMPPPKHSLLAGPPRNGAPTGDGDG